MDSDDTTHQASRGCNFGFGLPDVMAGDIVLRDILEKYHVPKPQEKLTRYQNFIKQTNEGGAPTEIFRSAGERWRMMSEAEKSAYDVDGELDAVDVRDHFRQVIKKAIDALEVMGVEAGAVIAVPGEDLVVTGAKAFTDELAASPGLLTRLIARRETSAKSTGSRKAEKQKELRDLLNEKWSKKTGKRSKFPYARLNKDVVLEGLSVRKVSSLGYSACVAAIEKIHRGQVVIRIRADGPGTSAATDTEDNVAAGSDMDEVHADVEMDHADASVTNSKAVTDMAHADAHKTDNDFIRQYADLQPLQIPDYPD